MGGIGGVPVQSTRFFGREAELAELRRIACETRLLSIVGAPGCGKTRLAVEVASDLRPRFPGGLSWVDLAPTTGPLVGSTVAGAAGVEERAGRPILDTLVDELGGADHLLLILDNCEHVLGEVAPLVERLLRECPNVDVLATSRAGLGLADESAWSLQGLDRGAAVDLFEDRASLARSSIGAADEDGDRDEDAAAIAAICARLDGVPLAIELVAAWARVLSPGQIAERLADALPFLTRRGRGSGDRHQTMRAAVDWSYRLLAPDAQRLFTRLTVFVGGFDFEAAEAVAPAPDEALAALSELVDHSLVLAQRVPGGTMRYRQLEPVRQCGAALLAASGEDGAVRRLHAEHYLATAIPADIGTFRAVGPECRRLVAREEDNVLAAIAWARDHDADLALQLCIGLTPSWSYAGRLNDGTALLRECLAADSLDPRLVGRAWCQAGHMAFRRGRYEEAHEWLEKAIARTRSLGDGRGTAAAFSLLSLLQLAEGDVDGTIDSCRESLAAARTAGDELMPVTVHLHLALAHYVKQDVDTGDSYLATAARLADAVGLTESTAAIVELTWAHSALLRGDVVGLRGRLLASLAAIRAGSVSDRADWLAYAAACAVGERRLNDAIRLFGGAAGQARVQETRHPGEIRAPIAAMFLATRQMLGRAATTRLYSQGKQMRWEELVAVFEAEAPESPRLTDREFEIAQLVAAGMSNADIARELVLSRRTVESHLDHIRRKLGFANRSQIVAWVLQTS